MPFFWENDARLFYLTCNSRQCRHGIVADNRTGIGRAAFAAA